ncbi:class I SAM-dependent methyltransferase [Ruminococcaceae bacterium OttesenSCG-928-N02]|nr:class I SAM-dependent methyltransferase [Ruminococcaceae bacterium OttesenSCG-928-N02]
MRPPLLDARLNTALAMVRPGSVVADVGTDHGHLALHLILSGKCPKVYALDVREKPLGKARALAARFGFEGQISCILSDGLAALPANAAQDVVIAGMGALSIAQIIANANWLQNDDVRLVLVPASNVPLLRQTLCEMGFEVKEEQAVQAAGRYYTVMCVHYSGRCYTPSALFCQVGKVPAQTPAAVGYIEKVIALQKTELNGKALSTRFELGEKAALVTALEGVLAQCRK